MKLSARNQLKATVMAVTTGAVNGVVTLKVGDAELKSSITNEAIAELGLAPGVDALAIVKASNVLVAAGDQPIQGISARNQLVGTVANIERGAVNGLVAIEVNGGATLRASITNEAIEALGLAAGAPAVAVVKATDVLVGVE
ncbi:TOBE domain-containing protein [Eggerthellaceae bacterium zg-997]|nr:TOBE domain-containing protein [Eggerthellaceae bacterium zg-997]